MSTLNTEFMRDIERRFRRSTRLANRAYYKIFYCRVHPARILALGINPGGTPSNTNPNGRTHKNGAIAAASAGYYGRNEHDLLDCEWRGEFCPRPPLAPLVGGEIKRGRSQGVKNKTKVSRCGEKKQNDNKTANTTSQTLFLAKIQDVKN